MKQALALAWAGKRTREVQDWGVPDVLAGSREQKLAWRCMGKGLGAGDLWRSVVACLLVAGSVHARGRKQQLRGEASLLGLREQVRLLGRCRDNRPRKNKLAWGLASLGWAWT